MSERHTACCIKQQYYALPTSPCTCPPGAGLDPDGWYVIDWVDGRPRIREERESDPDEQVMGLDDAVFEVQEWRDAQWTTSSSEATA